MGKATNKFEEIIGIVVPLLKQHPDYRLYITGHSLGGALSTLFAFTVAASNFSIEKPITCVSCASPKVGGNCFRKAFQVRTLKDLYSKISSKLLVSLCFCNIAPILILSPTASSFSCPVRVTNTAA